MLRKKYQTLDVEGRCIYITSFWTRNSWLFSSVSKLFTIRSYFTSEVSPPLNPKLQDCLLEYKIENYSINNSLVISKIENIKKIDNGYLSNKNLEKFNNLLLNITGPKIY